jgi:hypothetical protein
MPHIITQRSAGCKWFARDLIDGRVSAWSEERTDAKEFVHVAEAQRVKENTIAYRKTHPLVMARGAVLVIFDPESQTICHRCQTGVRPEGRHLCGHCGRDI